MADFFAEYFAENPPFCAKISLRCLNCYETAETVIPLIFQWDKET